MHRQTLAQIRELLNTDPVAQELVHATIPMRLSYIATDGTPRAIPISYLWDGENFIINSPTTWPKIAAFRAHPKVAFTVDSTVFPPHIMLVRGEITTIERREGVPQEYIDASRRMVGEDAYDQWEREIRTNITEMMVITITPTWVKVIDFVHTYPGS